MLMYCPPIRSLEKLNGRTTWNLSMLIHKTDAHSGGCKGWLHIGKYIHMDMDLKQIYKLSILHNKSLLRRDIRD